MQHPLGLVGPRVGTWPAYWQYRATSGAGARILFVGGTSSRQAGVAAHAQALQRDAMNTTEAVELITAAMPESGSTWADMGAGSGTFTRALARVVARSSRVYGVDGDVRACESP